MGGGRRAIEEADEAWDAEVQHVRGAGVRLPFLTWGRLGVLAVILGIGAAMVGEEPASKLEQGVQLEGHLGLIETIRFSGDGKTLLTSGWDRTVRIWDVEAGRGDGFGRELACLTLPWELYGAALSPDGRCVAAVGIEGLTLWNWTGEDDAPKTLNDVGSCRALAFSPDGRVLALGGYDGRIHMVDTEKGRISSILGRHEDAVRKMMFTSDSRLLISLSFDGAIKTWDLEKGRPLARFSGIEDASRPILTMAMSPVGDSLAVSRLNDDSGQIEIWDVAAGVLRTTCPAEDRETHALTFSRDGRVLASAGSDYRIRFWNATTGTSAGILDGETGWVRTLDFSADGVWMALSSVPDHVNLRRLALPAPLATRLEAPAVDASSSRRSGRA
ncbi:WD40 repeat domain-containing protein [Paludisphaera rhizosphaerae]|uniref:WD40 repeat domain-containing protein n=1 Tax=Paludisphaera rhizosphaerae TaxID=2711216 RepID=UPI0013EAFE11|nr:WD40 repeat domain-containing protein [Paludisphaera rhizosphaerae]